MEKRVYSCATAHLDTIWNWDFEHTVSTCLYNTLHDNFNLFEKYPDYKFNFEGSYRYELFEEYYPKEFEILKKYIKEGRWNVAGSAYENGDVNVPSPEALFRNILYGNEYFFKKFGKRSKDIFLPDCFGFGFALPSIISHANLLGFTTQKLTWGSAYGTPFDVGVWYGVNGKSCFACLKPDAYDNSYKDVRNKKDNKEKIENNEKEYDLPWTLSFHGTGDQGGSPKECSVKVLQNEINNNNENDVKVLSEKSDKIYEDLNKLTEEQIKKLPTWNNELVMRDHGAGGYTSRAIGKRLNRKGEELADMTERASVIAEYLGSSDYPKVQLEKAWKRIIGHQFHDDLPGTSVQRAYKRSWNDYFLSLNQLENEYENSVTSISKNVDTSWTKGTPIIVFNSLEQKRNDFVKFYLPVGDSQYYIAKDKEGNVYPVDVIADADDKVLLGLVCDVDSLGYKAFDIIPVDSKPAFNSSLKASKRGLENEKYKVQFNENGEIASVYDKELKKELLKEPIVHQLIDYAGSMPWPAWELTHKSVFSTKFKKPSLKSMRVIYSGFTSAAIEVIQEFNNSVFKSVVSLFSGSKGVRVQNEIEWWEAKTLLKDRFALAANNEKATYDLGLGAITRGNNTDKLFEVPAQKWANISEDNFGIGIISDSKYGWDKPNNNTLRMTVLHTPSKNYQVNSMQAYMDLGLNLYGYEICSHENKINELQIEARKFHQKLTAVSTCKHKGNLKPEGSFGSLSTNDVILRAMKKAENSDEIIVRFNEGVNKNQDNISFSFGNGILSAREVYASEEPIGDAVVDEGKLKFSLKPYEVKTFALTIKPSKIQFQKEETKNIKLPLNYTAFTQRNFNEMPVIKNFEDVFIPVELNPGKINFKGMTFKLDKEKALLCSGQKLNLNKKYNKVYFIGYSKSEDHSTSFFLDEKISNVNVINGTDYIGAWDLVNLKETARIKDCDLAYEFTHTHNEKGGDIIAKQLFITCYELITKDVNILQLPNDENFVILSAVGVMDEFNDKLLYPMYDRVKNRDFENNLTLGSKIESLIGRTPVKAMPQPPLVKRHDGLTIK